MFKKSLLAALVAFVPFFSACGGGGNWSDKKGDFAEPEKKDPIVDVLPVRRANLAVYERSTGRIEAHDAADVYARLSEVAMQVSVEVGDKVEAGKLLAKLDDRNVQIQLNSSRLALEESLLSLSKLKLDLDKAQADVKRIEEYYDPAKPEASKVFTKDAYDIAVLARSKAKNALESAEVQQRKAQSDVDKAELSLSQCTIRAPIAGIIVERNVRANELVNASTKLFRITDFTLLEVKLDVPEASLRGLREPKRLAVDGGVSVADLSSVQAAFCTVTAFPGDRFLGYLERVAPTVDEARGMVVVTVRVIQPELVDEKTHLALLTQLDPDSRKAVMATAKSVLSGANPLRLRPGMWVDARIAAEVRTMVLVAPGAALVGDNEVLWVVKRTKDSKGDVGSVRRLDIRGRRGVTSEGVFELLPAGKSNEEGSFEVSEGDYIVVRGQTLLRDSQKVRLNDLSR